MKTNRIIKTIGISMVISLLPIMCFAAGNGLEDSVNDGYDYLITGFLALLKAGGILGFIASLIGIVVTQDQESLKKLKFALIVCIFAVAIGFGASVIISGVAK